jgi:hypothetical protein
LDRTIENQENEISYLQDKVSRFEKDFLIEGNKSVEERSTFKSSEERDSLSKK